MTTLTLRLSALLLAMLALAPLARGAVVDIPATRDNTMFDLVGDTLRSSGSGPYLFAGDNSQGNTRRALLRFAVTDSIPAGSVIQGVELRLTMSQSNSPASRAVGLHRVTADWGEGASNSTGGSGAPSAAGDATWLHRVYPDQPWTSPGGDFEPIASATQAVAGTGVYAWAGEGLVADVQLWIDQPAAHFGWLLRGDESVSSSVKRFNARENGEAATRPVLVVTFEPPDVPVRAATWGEVKRLGRIRPR